MTEKYKYLLASKEKMQQELASIGCGELAAEILGGKDNLERAYNNIITVDTGMVCIKDKCRLLAKSNLPILIVGETGTGKELFAKLLHGNRPGQFVAVNCGGIPDTLIESEFFGCEKGAFTGSIARAGYFEEANEGTIFLDEISELDRSLQSKLLRVIQEKRVRRLGSNTEIEIKCRIISATNHQIEELKENNKFFRTDLYYRLAGSIIKIPPLRQRSPEDIRLIAATIIGESSWDMTKVVSGWFGNVRELINYCEEIKILGL